MFVRVLLAERMIDPARLMRTIKLLPTSTEDQDRLVSWVDGTIRELD